MTPMIPDPLSLDLGSQALTFGWTMDGSGLLLLAVLLIPWLLVGLAAVLDVLDPGALPADTTALVAPIAIVAPTVLREAA